MATVPPDDRRPAPPVPPITELTRIEPVYLARLEKQGVFTTGILLEVSRDADPAPVPRGPRERPTRTTSSPGATRR